MTRSEYPYAGLVLPDAQDLDPAPYLETAAAVLARLDPIEGGRLIRGAQSVFGATLGVQILSEEESDYGPRVLIEVLTRDGNLPGPEQDEAAAQILSETVLACLDHSSADILEWYSPDVLLDREDFIRLRSYVSPRRAAKLPEVDAIRFDVFEETDNHGTHDDIDWNRNYSADDHIAQGIRASLYRDEADDERPAVTDRLSQYRVTMADTPAEESRMSAAGWLLTSALAIFSLPVAAFVAITSGGKGMDLRLVSQAIAVTGLFTVLYHTDRVGQVVRMILN